MDKISEHYSIQSKAGKLHLPLNGARGSSSSDPLEPFALFRETRSRIKMLLATDLNFHSEPSSSYSHDFHAFPAKFPPQLPNIFIKSLTREGDHVLDPMMGSATTIIEAAATGRVGIGFDIDSLAVLLADVKGRKNNPRIVLEVGMAVIEQAARALAQTPHSLARSIENRFDDKTREFVDYWFSPETQLELEALASAIEKIAQAEVRDFLQLVFSAIIITKSGGVSLAWDLAHTRPHKLKQGLPKNYRPALAEFRKRLLRNVERLEAMPPIPGRACVLFGNAEELPLATHSVDLLITSPPYASNAIDYMRAHKFSLVWFGYSISELGDRRSHYIGGEKKFNFELGRLPRQTDEIVFQVYQRDQKKGQTLARYYSELQRVMTQTYRVLRPGRAAVFVVGSSTMRGFDTRTQDCLAEIGEQAGMYLVGIATRQLDRDRRMMPARRSANPKTLIENRMHEEYVIAWVKPPE